MALTLTGVLSDITTKPIEDVATVTVKAPAIRVEPNGLVTTQPQKIPFDETGRISITVNPGLGWLYLEGPGWSDSISFVAAEGMTSLVEAVLNATPGGAVIGQMLALGREEIAAALSRISGDPRWRRGSLDSSTVLNNFASEADQGIWAVTSAATAKSLKLPVESAGALTVVWLAGAGTPYAIQMWEPLTTGERWVRTNQSYGWSAWKNRVADVDAKLANNAVRFIAQAATADSDFSKLGKVGQWRVPTAELAASIPGLPEDASQGILTAYSTTGSTTATIRVYQGLDGRVWAQGLNVATSSYLPWSELGAGGAASGGAVPLTARARREQLIQSRGGRIGTGGKGVVAFRFDHNLRAFEDTILPMLEARGLPASMAHFVDEMNPNPTYSRDDSTGSNWSTVASHFTRGVEVWSHGWSHTDAADRKSMYKEIVESRAELEKQVPSADVQGWLQPGLEGTKYGGLGEVFSQPEKHASTYAGALIEATYGAHDRSGTTFTPLGSKTFGCLWIDSATSPDATIAAIDQAASLGMGIVIAMHPSQLGKGISSGTFTAILDHIVGLREAGKLEVLTLAGMSVADPSTTWRHTITPELSAWSGSATTKMTTAVSVTAHEYMRGSAREVVADVSGVGTVTLTVRDTNDAARLNVARTARVANSGAVRLPFGVPNSTTNLTIEAVVNGPTITGIKAQAI